MSEFKPMEIQTIPQQPRIVATPAALLEIAINQNADLAKLEKLMDLQLRWETNEARKAYIEAMSRFKADPPHIVKDRKVGYTSQKGTVGYSHASLANVTNEINVALSKNGLSAAWKTEQGNGTIQVTCTITHALGHSESTTLIASPDNSGSKNSIQAIGSTITYLQRYTILALTGLATFDQDDDGTASGAPVEFIAKEQSTHLSKEIKELYDDGGERFLKYMGAETVDTILAKDYGKAINALKAVRAKRGAK